MQKKELAKGELNQWENRFERRKNSLYTRLDELLARLHANSFSDIFFLVKENNLSHPTF